MAVAVLTAVLQSSGADVASASAPARGNPAHITSMVRSGRVVTLTISTPAFTTPTKVDVDLPTSYDAQPRRRWPVTYVLAGTMNTYASFNNVVHGVLLTKDFPAIVVSPNGDSGYWSDWYNNGALGPPEYETYVIDQLIPLIDATFRTIPTKAERAITGVSMGGYGAAMLAAEHPDLFADLSSISGADDSNLPFLAAAISVSSTFDGGAVDAIYGPRATQAVRWHGHNPVDLASNLRGLNIQVRTANGIPNPGIGEQPASADSVSCLVEAGVHAGSVDLHDALTRLGIAHLWKDYGAGCHTQPNFEREITDTLRVFTQEFAHPTQATSTFGYASIKPSFSVYGWHISADSHRALEFLRLTEVSSRGLTLAGSGLTKVTTPGLFRGDRRVSLTGATTDSATPDSAGRITFTVDLGAADTQQQYAPGAATNVRTVIVRLIAHR